MRKHPEDRLDAAGVASADPRIAVRRLQSADLELIDSLALACSRDTLRDRFFAYDPDPAARLRSQVRLARSAGAAVGAYAGDEMIALAVGLPMAGPSATKSWEIAVLVCDPYQGQGVGTRVLQRLIDRARESRATPYAVVEVGNARSLRLLRSVARVCPTPQIRLEMC